MEFKIPFKEEVLPIIKTIYINNLHCGYKALWNQIIINGYYWKGYSKEIERYIKSCHFYNEDKVNIKIKPQLRIIIDKGPKFRYVMDLWTLPEEL